MANPLVELYEEQGQSPWLDFIRRKMLEDGGLRRYVEEDGIRGVTANPTIFAKAIGGSDDYDAQVEQLVRQGVAPSDLFEHLAVRDLQQATDILRPVFDASDRCDGFVSIEVSPSKAFETQPSIDEAKRWWGLIERPNLFVKIPATDEGIPAIEEALAAGVNINITLIFSLEFHERVMEAYLRALERRVAAGLDINDINSVASFFVSRVDTLTDEILERRMATAASETERQKLASLRGKAAVANAKLAYQNFLRVFTSDRFRRLEAKGAKVQRPLWASTSTKNPDYYDIMYVQDLIGPQTVNTMPPQTIDAFRDHGQVRRTVDEGVEDARRVMSDLADLGISMVEITDQLQREGVEAFAKSYDEMTRATAAKAEDIRRKVSAA